MLSTMGRAVFGGDSVLYFALQAFTATILILAANTAYADFPRLASLMAGDRFLPRQLANRGDRLVFSNGILVLAGGSLLLIFAFGGDTSSLIPLYAVGVFMAFTLSQSGMVVHHWRLRDPGWRAGRRHQRHRRRRHVHRAARGADLEVHHRRLDPRRS